MDNYIGRLLDGRYEIMTAIGTGGMAVVYKARCHRLNRFVAIKILKDEYSQDLEFRRRFHAESQAVAMLSHPNIVNVYDVSHANNVDYIVMELIDGITLKQYMEKKGQLNWREVLHFATQIAKALEHAHSRGIIHRDIKPHNIMILKDGSVKVADFGIARVSSAQSTLTREALGSVHYISPEQAKGSKIDYRSDLYSLGVVMYEMLAGRPPYDGESPVSVAIQHINAKALPPRHWNPQVPLGLEQITMHAMTADVESRYESATEMLYDLDEYRKSPSRTFEFGITEAAEFSDDFVMQSVQAQQPVRKKRSQSAEDKKTQNRSNYTALIAGVICIFAALGAIVLFMMNLLPEIFTDNTDEFEVPKLVGEHIDLVEQSTYEGFTVRVVSWENHESIERGIIISQSPKHGRMKKRGTVIEVTVSSGPSTDTMRNVINETEENARNILNSLAQGLDLDIVVVYENSDIQTGHVIDTKPRKGDALRKGQTVTLYVSLGPAESADDDLITVPALVGENETTALQHLDALNLKYSVIYMTHETEKGTVIYQNIDQGERVPKGTTIHLNISSGPEEKPEVPELPEEDPIFYLPMPEGDGTVRVEIRVDGEVVETLELELASVSERGIPITLNGAGIHTVDFYIDDEFWYSMEYNFDTGEIVE